MIARQLYQLQELDLELESRKLALSQLISQLGESEAVVKLRSELASEQKHLEDLKHRLHTLEWEIDDITEKIKSAEDKLYGGTVRNPKELASLQQESGALKARRSHLEDTALDLMGQTDAISAGVDAKADELKKAESEWKARQEELSAEAENLKGAIAELESKRQSAAAFLSPQAVEFYQSLREQKGIAVAKVEQGRCCGCRILLAITEIQRSRNKMVQCSSCGRVLFVS